MTKLPQNCQPDLDKNTQEFLGAYDQNYRKIFNYALKRLGDIQQAEDITSETFCKGFLNLNKFTKGKQPILAWLYRIALNEIRIAFRKGKKYRTVSLDYLTEKTGYELPDKSASDDIIEAEAAAKSDADLLNIRQAIGKLPAKYQEVITLRYFEKSKISTIAEILTKKEGTIKSLLSRGLAKLKKELAKSSTQPSASFGINKSERPIKNQIKLGEIYDK